MTNLAKCLKWRWSLNFFISLAFHIANQEIRGGSIRPNLEGRIIKNQKAKNKKHTSSPRNITYCYQAYHIISTNNTNYIFGLVVKFSLTVLPYGQLNLAIRFSIIRPSGFILTDPPQKNYNVRLKVVFIICSIVIGRNF